MGFSLNSTVSRLDGMTKIQGTFALGDSLEVSAIPSLKCLQRQRPDSRSEALPETESTLFSDSYVCAWASSHRPVSCGSQGISSPTYAVLPGHFLRGSVSSIPVEFWKEATEEGVSWLT